MATLFWTRAMGNVVIDNVGYLRTSVGHLLDGWTIERVMVGFHVTSVVQDPTTIATYQVRGLLWGVVKLDDSDGTPNGKAPATSPNFDWLVTGMSPPDYRVVNYAFNGSPQADSTSWYTGPDLVDSHARRRNDNGQGQTIWWLANLTLDTLFPPGHAFGSVWVQTLLRVP